MLVSGESFPARFVPTSFSLYDVVWYGMMLSVRGGTLLGQDVLADIPSGKDISVCEVG